MGRFLKSQVLKETEGKHLLTVEYSKSGNLLSNSQIEVGENTRSALSKLTTDQQKVALTGMNQFYVETTKQLINHLPIDNKLLRVVSFLDAKLRHSEHGAQAIRRIAIMIPTISQEEVALITDEWNVYMAGAVDTDDTDCEEERVDHYWANVFHEKSHQGKFAYFILQKLVKGLSIVHDKADVELA